MKLLFALLIVLLAAAGCMTRTKARMKEENAFLAGQNAVLRQQAQAGGVIVKGAVQNHNVPWVAGLTLTQVIATANYLAPEPPQTIILTREGESAELDPKVLLDGTAVPLERGDVVELR